MLNQKDHQVLGYTIMPNHVHLLLYLSGGKQSLNTLIGNGKRFIGYEIVKRLGQKGDTVTLHCWSRVYLKWKEGEGKSTSCGKVRLM